MINDIFSIITTQLEIIFTNPLALGIIILFLFLSSYTDIKYLKVYNKYTFLFFILRIVIAFSPVYPYKLGMNYILGSFIGMLIIIIPAIITMQKMGGDIKFITVLGLYTGAPIIILILFLTCFTSLAFILLKKIIIKDENLINKRNLSIEDIRTKNKLEKLKNGFIPYVPFFNLSFMIIMAYYYLIH